jgi:hypothetical protein
MSMLTRPYHIAASTFAVATFSLVLSATPASAQPAPVTEDPPVSAWTCPTRIDTVAQVLRAEGFTAQAAKNIASMTHRECNAP